MHTRTDSTLQTGATFVPLMGPLSERTLVKCALVAKQVSAKNRSVDDQTELSIFVGAPTVGASPPLIHCPTSAAEAKTMSGIADWTRLPLEVLARIVDGSDERGCRFLDARYRFAAAHVCHQWRRCVTNPSMGDALLLVEQDPIVPMHLVRRFVQKADQLEGIVRRGGVNHGSPMEVLFLRVHDSWSLTWAWFEARLLNVSLIISACPPRQLLSLEDNMYVRTEYIKEQVQRWSPWIECSPAFVAAIVAAVLVATMHPLDIARTYENIVHTLAEADTWRADWFTLSNRAHTSAMASAICSLPEQQSTSWAHTVGSSLWYALMCGRTRNAADNLGRVLCRTAPVDAIYPILARWGALSGPFFVSCMRDAAVRDNADIADALAQIVQDHPLTDRGDDESTDTWEHETMRDTMCVAAVAGSRNVLLRFCSADRRNAHPCVCWNASAHGWISSVCNAACSDVDMAHSSFNPHGWRKGEETERWEIVAGAHAPLDMIRDMVSTQASFSRIAMMAGAVLAGRTDVITIVYEPRNGAHWTSAALYAAVNACSSRWLPQRLMPNQFARGIACLDGFGGDEHARLNVTVRDVESMCASLRVSGSRSDAMAYLIAQWPTGVAATQEFGNFLTCLMTTLIPGRDIRWIVLQHVMLALEAHAAGRDNAADQSKPCMADLWAVMCARGDERLTCDEDDGSFIYPQITHVRAIYTLVDLYVLACLTGLVVPLALPLSVNARKRFAAMADVESHFHDDDDDKTWDQAEDMLWLPTVRPNLADPSIWRRWCNPLPLPVHVSTQQASTRAHYKQSITHPQRLAVAMVLDALTNAGLVATRDSCSSMRD